jgi:hypothetical protein
LEQSDGIISGTGQPVALYVLRNGTFFGCHQPREHRLAFPLGKMLLDRPTAKGSYMVQGHSVFRQWLRGIDRLRAMPDLCAN